MAAIAGQDGDISSRTTRNCDTPCKATALSVVAKGPGVLGFPGRFDVTFRFLDVLKGLMNTERSLPLSSSRILCSLYESAAVSWQGIKG